MTDVFISYASADRDRARAIAKLLSDNGWSVWWNRSIPPGKSYDEVIEAALDSAKCVIVLWSKKSAASEWVKNEAAEGARRKILVPILIEDVRIPLEFRRIQAANLTTWKSSRDYPEIAPLFNSIESVAGRPTNAAGTIQVEETPRTISAVERREIARPARSVATIKTLALLQTFAIWVVLIMMLFNDYLHAAGFPLDRTIDLVIWPCVLTGVWLAVLAHSRRFHLGPMFAWFSVAGYIFSWVCLFIHLVAGTAFQVIGPTLFGIAVLPFGFLTLKRLRAEGTTEV
jgi:hypothetical protein